MDIDHLLALACLAQTYILVVILNYNLIKIRSICFDDIDCTNVCTCKLESEDEKNIVFLPNWTMKGSFYILNI